jgi:hypothetical protein
VYGGGETGIEYFVRRTEGKRPLERPRRGWEDNIKYILESREWEVAESYGSL